jgi:hypothetical protein
MIDRAIDRGSYHNGKTEVVWTRLFCDQCGRNLSFESRDKFGVHSVWCGCGRKYERAEIEALLAGREK